MKTSVWFHLGSVLAIGFAVCLALYGYSIYLNGGLAYVYLIFNLFLATIPLLIAWRIVIVLGRKRWSAWEPLTLTLLWVIFLPNSLYMISDYIHLQNMSNKTILYNAVMFSAFIYLALAMGLTSLYLIHQELRKRLHYQTAAIMVALIVLGCCFAIYLGRDLRWNSWDVVTNPGGLLFDISNLLLKPQKYPDMGRSISSFFVLIGSAYLIAWEASRLVWRRGVNDLAAHLKKRQNR